MSCCMRDKLVFETSSFKNSNSRHLEVIGDHCFNHKVSVILPGWKTLPKELSFLEQRNEDQSYFSTCLPLTSLIRPDFIEAFVKKGKLSMVSTCCPIDQGPVASLLPTGKLLLNVDKDTYQTLGILGEKSLFTRRGRNACEKYVIEVDLTSPSFVPGKKGYTQVYRCFKERLSSKFNFIYSWTPPAELPDVSPFSVPQYFLSLGYQWKEEKLNWEVKHLPNISRIPLVHPHNSGEMNMLLNSNTASSSSSGDQVQEKSSIPFEHMSTESIHRNESQESEPCYDDIVESTTCDELYDWLGCTGCHINCNSIPADDYLSSLSFQPQPSVQCPDGVLVCSLTGLVSTHLIGRLLHSLRLLMRSVEEQDWFVSFSVLGLDDSPVSWKTREHGFLSSGDNSYTYVVFPEENYWLYMNVGLHDICP